MARPFEGIRVLDLTHVLAGPYTAFQLAVQGADVIKIEPVDAPDCARGRGPDDALNALGLGVTYQVQGAEKRAVALDLKHPDGRAVFLDLVAGADVVLENYRAGALNRLRLDEAALRARRADLVLCSLTGWGRGGPREGVAAYDNVVQAAAGVIDRTQSVKPGLSFVDYAAGQAAAYAIACALFRRAREGAGQTLDVSMFETVLMQMAPEAAAALHAGEGAPKPKEPGIREYACADGALMLGAFTPAQTARLAALLEAEGFAMPALPDGAGWPALWQAAEPLAAAFAAAFASRPASAWQDWLQARGFAAEARRPLEAALADPHLVARGAFAALPVAAAGLAPVHASAAPFQASPDGPQATRPAPRHGEHTVEILREAGVENARIEALLASGAALQAEPAAMPEGAA